MTSINRREFLLASITGALATAKSAKADTHTNWNSRSTRSLRKFKDPVKTACPICPSHCSFTAYRYQGKVVGLLPDSGCCPRGLAMKEALYDPERLALPIRRVGERGSGKWEAISWEEAKKAIEKALGAPGKKIADLGRPDPLAKELLPTLGFDEVVTEESTAKWGKIEAQGKVYGGRVTVTLSEARTIILLGGNLLDEGDDLARITRELVAARKKGAKIVAVSSFEGRTGSFADQWIPVAPGREREFARALSLAVGRDLPLEGLGLSSIDINSHGVEYDVIAGLARRIGEEGAVCLSGASRGREAVGLESAAALINILGGAIEAGYVKIDDAPVWTGTPAPTTSREDLLLKPEETSLYLAYRANPVYASHESGKAQALLKDEAKVRLLVAFDTHITETAKIADIVLPAAADLESWNIMASAGKVALQQPVAIWDSETSFLRRRNLDVKSLFDGPSPAPLGEARQLGELLLLLAGREGAIESEVSKLAGEGGSLSYEMAEVKKVDLSALAAKPAGRPAEEAGSNITLKIMRKEELDCAYPNSRWGREIAGRSALYINRETAKKLGIEKKATVTTPMGHFTAPVIPIEGIHPGLAVIPEGFGHWGAGSVATASGVSSLPGEINLGEKGWLRNWLLTARPLYEIKPWWFKNGPGVAVKKYLPINSPEELPVTIKPVRG